MRTRDNQGQCVLKLRVGDPVKVRSEAEILSTLDDRGRLDALPFMPEMLQYCGKQFRVFKRADKVCDTIVRDGLRRMHNTVFLEGLRCDGNAHGGCETGCAMFWKEAWLKRVPEPRSAHSREDGAEGAGGVEPAACTTEALLQATRKPAPPADPQGAYYVCQATQLREATAYLAWWDPRQYWRDLRSGNVGPWPLLRAFGIWIFNVIQTYRRGAKYPFIEGKLKKTPALELNLQPGELVQLRSKDEILKTLNVQEKNRGLSFDRELVRYCGGTYRVLRRVNRLVDEKTGRLLHLSNTSIILDGVTCKGEHNRYCPRDIYHFVREIWLRRVGEVAGVKRPTSSGDCSQGCPQECVPDEQAGEFLPPR